MKKYGDNFLNDIEKAELTRFVDNPTMFQAVKKVLLSTAYYQGTLTEGKEADATNNFALQIVAGNVVLPKGQQKSAEQIGLELMARWEGINFVESGFDLLKEYQSATPVEKVDENPAR